ncbi:hypothetical protein IGI04_023490 [Brassica rapa subsp. trilocularis]|uniref:Uncharacterized protein n=1 Tax=Brassica rapa subsp. trilocularis TaxID=1813537 RepID=A0ABQ7M406_BRACM|nr:hypothetical protein IGI04_023490 [Brassica rapa subsp. trilocularis]
MSFCSLSRRLPLIHALSSNNCDMEEDDEDRERLVLVVHHHQLHHLVPHLSCLLITTVFITTVHQHSAMLEPPRSSPPFINTAPCWRRALVQPRDVNYDVGGVENVIRWFAVGEIEIHGGTLVFLVIKSSDPFRVLNISKGEGYSVKSRASLVLLLWKRRIGDCGVQRWTLVLAVLYIYIRIRKMRGVSLPSSWVSRRFGVLGSLYFILCGVLDTVSLPSSWVSRRTPFSERGRRVLQFAGLWRGALSSGYQYIRNCDLLIAIIKVSITITYELKFSGLLFLVVVIMTQSQLVSLLERLGMGRTVREITSI